MRGNGERKSEGLVDVDLGGYQGSMDASSAEEVREAHHLGPIVNRLA